MLYAIDVDLFTTRSAAVALSDDPTRVGMLPCGDGGGVLGEKWPTARGRSREFRVTIYVYSTVYGIYLAEGGYVFCFCFIL